MKVIFIGDLVGKMSRKALKEILPLWREKYAPDFVVANGENLAHGLGISQSTFNEVLAAGVDVVTTGDHAFDKEDAEVLFSNNKNLIRPANFPPGAAGQGEFLAVIGQKNLLVINLIGRVFMKQAYDCPFRKLDEILKKYEEKKPQAIIVDFHGEATSEKAALGFYADGRVSAVLGTHTHVATTDAKILPKSTAFVSDVGMVGARDSVIGDRKEEIISAMLNQTRLKIEPVEEGVCVINAVLIEIDENTGLSKNIKRIDEEIYID